MLRRSDDYLLMAALMLLQGFVLDSFHYKNFFWILFKAGGDNLGDD